MLYQEDIDQCQNYCLTVIFTFLKSDSFIWCKPVRIYVRISVDSAKPCTCSSTAATRYQKRISGQLMDWIDIHMQMSRVEYHKLHDIRNGDSLVEVRMRIKAAHQLQLTARAYHRVLKLSRTIADLVGAEAITQAHLAEALQYRAKIDRF